MNNQKDLIRTLLMFSAAYMASRAASKYLKWAILGGLVYVAYRDNKTNGIENTGWGVQVDYSGLVNTIFPTMEERNSDFLASALGTLAGRMTRP